MLLLSHTVSQGIHREEEKEEEVEGEMGLEEVEKEVLIEVVEKREKESVILDFPYISLLRI